jgi:hypothetical protein
MMKTFDQEVHGVSIGNKNFVNFCKIGVSIFYCIAFEETFQS